MLACEKALLLDPQGAEALELLDRTRKAIDEQKITEWLAGAQQLLGHGDVAGASELIDQALSLDNTSEPGADPPAGTAAASARKGTGARACPRDARGRHASADKPG